MSSSFSLAVCFDGDGESSSCSGGCEQEFMDSLSLATISATLDNVFLIRADSVALYLNRSSGDGGGCDDEKKSTRRTTTMLAIFVPPTLFESCITDGEAVERCCGSIRLISALEIQATMLAKVHQILPRQQCRIRGLIRSAGSKRPRDSDVLLLDISHCKRGWLDEMRLSICGEPMAGHDAAAIQLFALSQVTTTVQRPEKEKEASSPAGPLYEIPTCAVCLHRIYPPRLGMPKPRNEQLCSEYCISECRNEIFLKPWPAPSHCKACNMIDHHWRNIINDDVFCFCCALQETLWICLTCGFIGCGRYSQGHAANHFQESQHAFSLEMATFRIWDYPSGEFAHRGDLLVCPSVRKHHPQWAMLWGEDDDDSNSNNNNNSTKRAEAPPKKATKIGEEYEVLLQSALEDQAQHYEGEISRLHAQLTAERIDEDTVTESEAAEIELLKTEIAGLRDELEIVGRSLLDMQAQEAGHRAASQRLLREQAVAKDLLDKIREEAAKENQEGKSYVDELEQQVADLSANLRMRQQISQYEELSQAQIYGTVASPVATTTGKSFKQKGKKSRRGNRK